MRVAREWGMACQSLVNVEVEVYICRIVSIRGGSRSMCSCVCGGGGAGIGYKKSSCSRYHDTEIPIVTTITLLDGRVELSCSCSVTRP